VRKSKHNPIRVPNLLFAPRKSFEDELTGLLADCSKESMLDIFSAAGKLSPRVKRIAISSKETVPVARHTASSLLILVLLFL
jgi:hypothetical protein